MKNIQNIKTSNELFACKGKVVFQIYGHIKTKIYTLGIFKGEIIYTKSSDINGIIFKAAKFDVLDSENNIVREASIQLDDYHIDITQEYNENYLFDSYYKALQYSDSFKL